MAIPRSSTDPHSLNLDSIVAIILENPRARFDPDVRPVVSFPTDADILAFVRTGLERTIERAVRAELVGALYRCYTRSLDNGEDASSFTALRALHYLDGVIKDTLLSPIGTFFGKPSGNADLDSGVLGLVLGAIVNDVLRRVYEDLGLSNLPTSYGE